MTIYCEYCGGVQETGAKYCPSCGARITQQAVKTEEAAQAEQASAAETAAQSTAAEEAEATTQDTQEDSAFDTVMDVVGDVAKVGGGLLTALFGTRRRKAPQARPPEHSRFQAPRTVVQRHPSARPGMPMQEPGRRAPGAQRPMPGHRGPEGHQGFGGPGGAGNRGPGGHGGPGGRGRR